MASVNKVILLGNIGKDPEVRYTAGGMAVCNLTLATSSKRKDKNSGEAIEETQWHRLVLFDRLAEIAGEYVKKGSPLFVEGWLKYGKYEDKDGTPRYTTDVIVTSLQLLGSRDRDGGGREAPQRQAPAERSAPPQRSAPKPGAGSQGSGFDDMDDDIPF